MTKIKRFSQEHVNEVIIIYEQYKTLIKAILHIEYFYFWYFQYILLTGRGVKIRLYTRH